MLSTTATEKDYIKNGYKKLYEDGWICRVKRSHYMLSPAVIAIDPTLVNDVVLLWNTHCHIDAQLLLDECKRRNLI